MAKSIPYREFVNTYSPKQIIVPCDGCRRPIKRGDAVKLSPSLRQGGTKGKRYFCSTQCMMQEILS